MLVVHVAAPPIALRPKKSKAFRVELYFYTKVRRHRRCRGARGRLPLFCKGAFGARPKAGNVFLPRKSTLAQPSHALTSSWQTNEKGACRRGLWEQRREALPPWHRLKRQGKGFLSSSASIILLSIFCFIEVLPLIVSRGQENEAHKIFIGNLSWDTAAGELSFLSVKTRQQK